MPQKREGVLAPSRFSATSKSNWTRDTDTLTTFSSESDCKTKDAFFVFFLKFGYRGRGNPCLLGHYHKGKRLAPIICTDTTFSLGIPLVGLPEHWLMAFITIPLFYYTESSTRLTRRITSAASSAVMRSYQNHPNQTCREAPRPEGYSHINSAFDLAAKA